jgi:hypothetical protein
MMVPVKVEARGGGKESQSPFCWRSSKISRPGGIQRCNQKAARSFALQIVIIVGGDFP